MSNTVSYAELWLKYDPKEITQEIWFEPSQRDDLPFTRRGHEPPKVGSSEEATQKWFERTIIPATRKTSWAKVNSCRCRLLP
jgi:hypothetical protein